MSINYTLIMLNISDSLKAAQYSHETHQLKGNLTDVHCQEIYQMLFHFLHMLMTSLNYIYGGVLKCEFHILLPVTHKHKHTSMFPTHLHRSTLHL